MIDWKRKLTSRKFWMAVASFVSMLVIEEQIKVVNHRIEDLERKGA